jgi:hypothetical protein
MNLLLLPKQLKDLIGEFNVDHRPLMRVVMKELLIKYEERIENDKYCVNCGNDAEEQYSNNIFWHKYNFCGEWCRHDIEYHIRKLRFPNPSFIEAKR